MPRRHEPPRPTFRDSPFLLPSPSVQLLPITCTVVITTITQPETETDIADADDLCATSQLQDLLTPSTAVLKGV